jgi:hypothetical protein
VDPPKSLNHAETSAKVSPFFTVKVRRTVPPTTINVPPLTVMEKGVEAKGANLGAIKLGGTVKVVVGCVTLGSFALFAEAMGSPDLNP